MNTSHPKNILIIRFSAMGDVVLSIPVIQNLLKKYPNTQITILTKPFFKSFFKGIENVRVFPVDLKNRHKGLLGLYRLVKDLNAYQKFDCVLDLHSVMRSWIITCFFRFRKVSFYRIDKGRAAKKNYIKGKTVQKLPHTTERYQQVFKKAGFNFTLQKSVLHVGVNDTKLPISINKDAINIGIAPFAAHKSKEWGLTNIQLLIAEINKLYKVQFYLFGGGEAEVQKLTALAANYSNVTNIAGKLSLDEELVIMQALKVFIGMDSGNMHIAALLGLPVVSIWGGTHPDLGFAALYQPAANTIQISQNDLVCRPCSVYGTAKCKLDLEPFACMTQIAPAKVITRLEELEILE